MSHSDMIITYIGVAYRLRKKASEKGDICVLEAQYGGAWEQVREWDDPGHVANILVKYGIAADHAAALKLLGVTSCDAA